MPVDQAKASSYIGEVKDTFHKNPEKLSSDERRCLKRYFDEIQASKANQADMLNLNNEVVRAQASIRSLELQQQSHLSKAEAMLDVLIDRKFEVEVEEDQSLKKETEKVKKLADKLKNKKGKPENKDAAEGEKASA
jgi:hypothetical protein